MLTSHRFPYVDVLVTIGTWSLADEAYVDTGFEGGLLLPSYLRHDILAAPTRSKLKVADGAIVEAPSWLGTVELAERVFSVEIAALGSRFLLGRDVLDQLSVCFEQGKRIVVRSE